MRPTNIQRQEGQILIISLIFFLIILVLTASLYGFVNQNTTAGRRAWAAEQARSLAEAGIDKAVWQLNQTTGTYSGETNTVFWPGVFDVTVNNISGNSKEIIAVGYVPNKTSPLGRRELRMIVGQSTTTASFFYGVQVGEGGLTMANNSRVTGNIYANGTIDGDAGAIVTGDAVSAGASGRIFDRVSINGNARAHTINNNVTIGGNAYGQVISQVTVGGSVYTNSLSNCTVGGSAYYTTISSCSVGGSLNPGYPGDPDPGPQSMPIPDSQLDIWKSQAASGGTISGNYIVTGGAQATLGPKKIAGNLTLSNNAKLTLTGPLWVTGSINISNNGILALASSYGNISEVVISDSTIDVSNNAIFQRAGPTSYILLTTTSPVPDTFQVANNADALIAYAPYGEVELSNNVQIREATAWKIDLKNNSTVTYETGLASLLFSAGPGGSWAATSGTLREIK